MKNRTILFTAALLFAISPIVAGNTVTGEPQVSQVVAPAQCGVSYDQIYMYMMERGYIVTAFIDIEGTCDVGVKTTIDKTFVVHIMDGVILGHDDSDF